MTDTNQSPDLAALAKALLDLELTAEQQVAFGQYQSRLIDWNRHTNLTAIDDPAGITIKHFLDSLSVLKVAPFAPDAKLIDVGTGAGFPGLPLRIVRPDLRLTLLEATGKKTAFLKDVVTTLHLDRVNILTARAEDAGQMADQRASYDLVMARAVAQLPILAEYLLPFCKVGGRCIALKGTTAAAEIEAAAPAIQVLGGKVSACVRVDLPTVAEPHYLVVIDKISATPAIYPRRAGLPSKKPLGV